VYEAPDPDTPEEAWTVIRTIATTSSYAWVTIPLPAAAKRFYRVTAILPDPIDPEAPDGSTYWGEHEQ
jgi:hypothetical protein